VRIVGRRRPVDQVGELLYVAVHGRAVELVAGAQPERGEAGCGAQVLGDRGTEPSDGHHAAIGAKRSARVSQ
jgi:hypothetical protein